MASKRIFFQDDSIQLLETASSQENLSNAESSTPSILKIKRRNNKIHSPPPLSPSLSLASSSDISDLFQVKKRPQLPPVPRPRTAKIQKNSTSEIEKKPDFALKILNSPKTVRPTSKSQKKPEFALETLKSPKSNLSVSKSVKTSQFLEFSKENENTRPQISETPFSEAHSLLSGKSEPISYKEQLRNRFLSVKKKAGSSISQTHTPVSRASKFSKNKFSIEDTALGEENNFIDNELKKREIRTPNFEEGYDYFCKIFKDGQNQEANPKSPEKNEKDKSEDVDAVEQESVLVEKDSIMEFLGLEIPEIEPTEIIYSEKINFSDNEKELFWNKNRFEEPEIEEIEFRNLEDEGIFCPEGPDISTRKINVLKEKLKYENRYWFEDSYEKLKILPDPRLSTSFKPFKFIENSKNSEKKLEIKYFPAQIALGSLWENASKTSYYPNIFEIKIFSIKFSHHPLFSPEHVLAQKLIEYHSEFSEIKNSNRLNILEKTFEALINARDRFLKIEKHEKNSEKFESSEKRNKKNSEKPENSKIQVKNSENIVNIRKIKKNFKKSEKFRKNSEDSENVAESDNNSEKIENVRKIKKNLKKTEKFRKNSEKSKNSEDSENVVEYDKNSEKFENVRKLKKNLKKSEIFRKSSENSENSEESENDVESDNNSEKLENTRKTKKSSKYTENSKNSENSKIYEKYSNEISEIREKILTEGKNYRDLIKRILGTWKALKIVRASQKFTNTTLKLIITKEIPNFDSENSKYEKFFDVMFNSIVDDYEKKFRTELGTYKKEFKNWKIQKTALEDLPKPKKPQKNFDHQKLREELALRFRESLRHPNEPILDFEVIYDPEILTKDPVNPKELLRKSDLKKNRIFAKIFCDKIPVCKTKSISLNDNFFCEFSENFSIKLNSDPKNLKLRFFEEIQNKLNKKLIWEIDLGPFLKGPNFTEKVENFVKNEKIFYNHNGVGSEISTNEIFKAFDVEIFDEILTTRGQIKFGMSIYEDGGAYKTQKSDKTQKLRETSENFGETSEYFGETSENFGETSENFGETSENFQFSSVLRKIPLDLNEIEGSKIFLDPQDPQNSVIHEFFTDLEFEKGSKNYFHLEPYSNLTEFCDFEEIEKNSRFRMLILRDRNEPEFQNILVPNRIKEISKDTFMAYERRVAENQSPMVPEDFQKNDIEGQRKWASKFLQIAENKVVQLSKIAENKINLSDVITEDAIPTLGSLGLSFMNWFQPNRPLRPTRKITKPVTQQVVSVIKDVKIVINIIGAIQVPIRKETDNLTDRDSANISLVPVRPFVIASYKDKQARTTVSEGANPIWNQELVIPLDNVNEATIHNIHGSLHLNLYDETISDLTEDDRLRHTNIHQQLGYNWLGGIQFPISTLLYNKRIEGSFKINTPSILLGYENNATQFYSDTVSHRQDTYLTIFVTMQPFVERIRRIQPTLECTEIDYIEDHIITWEEQYKLLQPNRNFSCLVTNISGEMTCVTRYFKPINPPEIEDDNIEITQEFCARYVSMIPFRESTLSNKIPNIWLTADQLLTLSMGSVTDHAILLTCLLMTLDIDSWLVIGWGIPHGVTSYVLIKEKNSYGKFEFFVYDVETGFKYNVKDNFCPMLKVYCIINGENVWGNIQIEERAHMTKYDVIRSADWLPLFNKKISAPFVNVQKIMFNYIELPSVKFLQEKIEKKLRQKIMKWRKHNVTIWNHYCSSVLKQILPYMESNCLTSNSGDFDELQSLFNSYKMRGFAVCFPFTSFKQLCNYVRGTKLHFNENPNTEFAMAVYLHAYPNYTIVTWLFLASLVRRR